MLKKTYVRSILTNRIYEAYYIDNNSFNTPFFKKDIMKKIIDDINEINQLYQCNIEFLYDRGKDVVICKDNEFKQTTMEYVSHSMHTTSGLMKLYYFGDELIFDKIIKETLTK